MRRFLQSKQYPDAQTFAPMLEIIYYDEKFDVYQCLFKLSVNAVQDINIRGCIGDKPINGVDTFFELSDDGTFHCKLIENKIYNGVVDIDSIESDTLKSIEDMKSFNSFVSYREHYDILLENIKIYRRQKNLDRLV